jgi:hypothetical protein
MRHVKYGGSYTVNTITWFKISSCPICRTIQCYILGGIDYDKIRELTGPEMFFLHFHVEITCFFYFLCGSTDWDDETYSLRWKSFFYRYYRRNNVAISGHQYGRIESVIVGTLE